MKLNYVSVKGYEDTEDGLRLCILAEIDEPPPRVWSKLFQLTWSMSPASRSLPAEIKFNKNNILFYIPGADKITETIEALNNTIKAVDRKFRDMNEEPSYNLNEVMI